MEKEGLLGIFGLFVGLVFYCKWEWVWGVCFRFAGGSAGCIVRFFLGRFFVESLVVYFYGGSLSRFVE